jgi:hypothetical protein
MTIRLSTREKEILNYLEKLDIDLTARAMNLTTSTVQVHLYHIRRKYKEARLFVNTIDALKGSKPTLRKALRSRE